jgi:DnaJ like chaperone protein
VFFSAVLRLGAKLCKADGRISRDEVQVFKRTFKIDPQTVENAARIFEEAAVSSQGVEEIAGEVFSLVGDNRELLEYVVVGLMQVAAADGTFHKLEAILIRRICDAFGFPEAKTLALFAMFGAGALDEEAEQTGEARDVHTQRTGTGLVEIYLRILGLGPEASREEIKAAYRKLAREHHPDALRAKGVPIDTMRQSEEVLKKINEAYAYLRAC